MASTGRLAPLFKSLSGCRAVISALTAPMERPGFSLASTVIARLVAARSLTRIACHTMGNGLPLPGTSEPGAATPTTVTVRPGLSSKLLPSTSGVPPNRVCHKL